MVRLLGGLLACCLAGAPAAAADWNFGGAFGTLGMGPQLAVRSTHFGAHVDGAFIGMKGHVSSRNARYGSDLDLRSAGMMLDLFPFGGRFHLSAGTRYAGYSGRVRATPGQQSPIAGATTGMGMIQGRTDTSRLVPALSTGIGNKEGEGFTWRIEGGVLFEGGVRLSQLSAGGGLIQAERLAAERNDLQVQLGRYHLFPVAQFEMGYRF